MRVFSSVQSLLSAVFFMSAAFIMWSCSDDDDRGPSGPAGSGVPSAEISFTVSGADTGQKSGECFASVFDFGGQYFVYIDGNDGIEETDPEVTFIIGFEYTGDTPLTPGTYPLGYDAFLEGEGMMAEYEIINESEDSARLFGNIFAHEGSIVISEVTVNSISGSFSFTAADEDGEEVTLTNGQFQAAVSD